MQKAWLALVLLSTILLAACVNDTPRLKANSAKKDGPDEFLIVPYKPLKTPPRTATLLVPNPNAGNLAQIDAGGEAIRALGGSSRSGKAGDKRLMAHVSRLGVEQKIIEILAGEDLEWRKKNRGRLLERAFNVQVYYKAYLAQTLDPIAESKKWAESSTVKIPKISQ